MEAGWLAQGFTPPTQLQTVDATSVPKVLSSAQQAFLSVCAASAPALPLAAHTHSHNLF